MSITDSRFFPVTAEWTAFKQTDNSPAMSVQEVLRETVSVKRFGAVGDGVTDDTAAIQAAIDFVSEATATDPYDPTFAGGANIGTLLIPAGIYKTKTALIINKPIKVIGDGTRRTIIRLSTSNTALHAVNIGPTVNGANLIGGSFGGMSIICNGGSAVGNGVYLTTAATASGLTMFTLHDLNILNVRNGVSMSGVIYMNTFRNITVSGTFGGTVGFYGWYVESPLEVIYNTFQDLEVTSCADGAYAYWINSAASQFRNLTADNCCYFAGAYSHISGLTIEGMPGAAAATNAIKLNQIGSAQNIAIINVPNAKCQYGVHLIGSEINLSNVRFPDAGAGNQPNRALFLANGSGVISSIKCDRAVVNKLETYTSESVISGYVLQACDDITDYSITHQCGTWTPNYSGWSTAPTTINASYIKIGRQVTVTLYATNGVNASGGTITGLPFQANASIGAAAAGSCSDTAKRLCASVLPGGSSLVNIPASLTLTSTYWQMTCTYFV